MAKAHKLQQDEDLDSLVARVRVLLNEIDLDRDMSERLAASIAVAELSGTRVREFAKKLLVLESQGRLSGDEYRRLIISDAFN